MFEEKEEIDVTVLHDGTMQIRTAKIVLRDGVEIARSYHRNIVTPGESTDDQPEVVKAIAPAVWTEDKLAEYENKVEQIEQTLQLKGLK